ncbi:MAG: hypothetical protein INQ03_00360 [Candidatus Heimdallarchaeota archaeon]|nr:hypothetical protein [Candidatus Heimdallarchaeota archaeon]
MTEEQPKFDLYFFTVFRILFGWIFFWAFIDKAFGIKNGWDAAWFGGKSPTAGFLGFVTAGNPIGQHFASLGGNLFVDILYMFGMLGFAVSLWLGIGRKICGVTGALLMVLMYLVEIPTNLQNNPFMEEHLVYTLIFIMWGFTQYKGMKFIKAWDGVVEKYPFLE